MSFPLDLFFLSIPPRKRYHRDQVDFSDNWTIVAMFQFRLEAS